MSVAAPIQHAASREVAQHPNAVRLGRIGWFAKGVVYLLTGVLALVVALHALRPQETAPAEGEASPTGAIRAIAGSPPGSVLLWAMAAGLILYALWRLATVILPGSGEAEGMLKRAGYLVSAVIYTTLALTAISLARDDDADADGNQRVRDLSYDIMSNSVGRWLIGLAGLIGIGAGVYHLVKGLRRGEDDEVDLSNMSETRRTITRSLFWLGEIGRGLAIGLIGFFLTRAAIRYRPGEATGLDGALRRLSDSTWGTFVVAIVGVGFIAYAAYCLTTFTRRRLHGP